VAFDSIAPLSADLWLAGEPQNDWYARSAASSGQNEINSRRGEAAVVESTPRSPKSSHLAHMPHTQTLDPAQEIRIESVHRGFLYQHLYAAACILTSAQIGANSVMVERDEDIELVTSTGRTYIQVKTCGQKIMPVDIKSALERFDALRQEHLHGRRQGRASFVVVVNRALSPSLAEQVKCSPIPLEIFTNGQRFEVALGFVKDRFP